MKLKLPLGIIGILFGILNPIFSQEIVLNNFEPGSPMVTASYGASYTNVANPLISGINLTANCGEIKRTSANWYELVRFTTSFNVPANTTKYIHLMVKYTSSTTPNMSIRIDASSDNDGAVDIYPINTYASIGQWQDMVFEINGGVSGVSATQMLFFADAAVNSLNNTDSFAYIDEMVLNDIDTPEGYDPNLTLNDFEAGSPVVTASYGAIFTNVPNPLISTGNTTDNCGEIRRTTGNWYELIRFSTYFNVPANTTKYIHIRVRYTSTITPNMSIRIDATPDSDGSTDIYPTVNYTSAGAWQDMVFEIAGGDSGITATQFLLFADSSVNVLNNTDSFAYIDEIVINDTATPEVFNTDNFLINTTLVKVFPNPSSGIWNFVSSDDTLLTNIQIVDISGKTVINEKPKTNNISIDCSHLAKGIYFANISYQNETQTLKIVKE